MTPPGTSGTDRLVFYAQYRFLPGVGMPTPYNFCR